MSLNEALIDDVDGEETLESEHFDGTWGTVGLLCELFDSPKQFLRTLPTLLGKGHFRLKDDETGLIITLN